AVVNPTSGHAQPPVAVTASSVTGSDGTVVTATSHLVQTGHPTSGEYLVVWAGDENAADNSAAELANDATHPALNPVKTLNDDRRSRRRRQHALPGDPHDHTDVRQSARHSGPRGPESDGHLRLCGTEERADRSAQARGRPSLPGHRAHLGHQRPRPSGGDVRV